MTINMRKIRTPIIEEEELPAELWDSLQKQQEKKELHLYALRRLRWEDHCMRNMAL